MSAGGRGTYSITIHVDASQALSTLNQVKSTITSLGPQFQSMGAQMQSAGAGAQKLGIELQKAVGSSSALGTGVVRLNGPLGQLNSQINTTAATLPRMASAQQQAAAASKQNAQAMQNQIQRMTAMGSRIGGIAFMFTGLTAAMGEAQGMSELLAESEKKLQSEQEKAAAAIQKYGKESFQATRALEAVEKAERAVAFQSRITTLSIQDQFFFIGGLASIALPSVITVFGKLRQAMKAASAEGKSFGTVLSTSLGGVGSKLNTVVNGLITGLNRLTPSFAQVSTGARVTATNVALNTTALSSYTAATGVATGATRTFSASLIALARHPVIITIMALAAAYTILATNTFESATRFREFGAALGQSLPILQPFLDLIDGIAKTIGIAGGATEDAAASFQRAGEGFANLGTLWHDTLANMQASNNEFISFIGNLGVIVSDAFVAADEALQRFGEGLQQAPGRIGAAFSELGALISRDVTNAFDSLVKGAQALPGQILSALSEIGSQIYNTVVQPIVDAFLNIPAQIGALGEQIAQSLGLDQLANWVIQTVIPAIGNAFNQIVNFVQPIGSLLYDALHIADLLTLAGQIAQGVVDAFNAIPSFVQNIGQQLWDTLGFGWLQEQLQGFFDWLATNLGGIGGEAPGGMSFGELAMKGIMNEEQLKAFEEATKFKPTPFQPTAPTQESTFGGIGSISEQQRRQLQGGQIPITLPIAPERGGPTGLETIGGLVSQFVQQQARDLEPSIAGGGGITPTNLLEAFPEFKAMRDAQGAMRDIKNESIEMWDTFQRAPAILGPMAKEMQNGTMTTQQFQTQVEKLQETEEFSDETKAALIEGYKAYSKVLREGGTEADALAERDRVLSAEEEHLAEVAETGMNVRGDLNNATRDMANTLKQTADIAADGTLATQMQTQGMHEAAQAALDYGAELEKSTAFNQRWGEIIESSAFRAAAFETGVQKQVKALQDQKVALLENEGVLSKYAEQVASGEAGQLAFTKGVQDQQKALLDSQVALEETRGRLETYAQQLASGEQQAVAFAEGQQAVQQSFLDMIRSVSEIQGQISEYDRLLADGTAQTIAFAQGMAQGQLAAREFQVNIAAANGEYQGFRDGLISGNPELQKFGDLAGFTTEQIQQMAAAMLGSREAINSLVQGFREAASGFTDFLGSVDIRDLDEEFEDAVDDIREGIDDMIGIAEDRGIEVPKALENAIDFESTKQKAGQQLSELWPAITGVLEAGANSLDPEIMSSAIDIVLANIDNVFKRADLPETTKQVIDGIITEIDNLRNVKDPKEFLQRVNNIGNEIKALAENTDGTEELTTALTGLTNVPAGNLATLAERIAEVSGSVESLIVQRPELEKYADSLESIALNAPGTFKAAFPGQETGMERADVGDIPPEFGTQVQQIDTSEATKKLQDLQQLAAATVERVKIELEKLGPITATVVGQMNLGFSSVQDTWPQIMTTTIETINTQFTTLISSITTAVGQMNQAFADVTNQMITALQGVGNMAEQVGTQIQTSITNAVNTAAQAVNTATNTMITALQGVQNMATQTAQSFAQIGDAANAAAQVVNSATNTMITALQGVISMAEQVAQSIQAIGAAAQSAESDVQSLSSAISNIPDGEAVIRVTWDVAPAPPGVTGFGVGLGFTRSGTVTYTASGGSGGGITGGIPGGITPAGGGGGGPGEPSLQFGAQHGLGHFGGKDTVKAFNDLGILSPVLINHPMRMLVGENGPELVSVTPVNRNRTLRSGELSPFVSRTSSKPLASFAHGLGGSGGDEDAIIGSGAGFGGTINIGSGTVVFKENQAPVTINNIQQGFGGGIGGTSGGTFAGSTPTSGFGTPNNQGTFNVPGGQVSVMGNAVACVNGQCFGNMSGFGPNIGGPQQLGGQNIPQNAQFQPVTNQEGMIDAIETLKEWFKFLGIPLGGIGGAGTTMEDILQNFNPFNQGFGGGFGGMGGFGMGGFGGGATAVAGKGFAMASAGKATAVAGQPPGGGMFGGGFGMMTSDPSTWRIVMSQGFGGHPVFFVVNEQGFPVSQPFMSVEDAQRFIIFASMSQQQAQQFPQGGTIGGAPGGGQFQNIDIQGNPALLNTPFFNNFFGGQNPFVQGTQNPGTQFTPGTGGQGQINMTGGQIVFDQNAGCIDMSTSTGTIAIAGKGGAFAQAGGASASAGFAGSQFGPSPTEQSQLRQFESLNNNLTNIGNMLGETNQEFTQFQQTQQDAFFGPTGLLNQPTGGGNVFGTGPGQLFQSGNFTGFGQSFQPLPGGGAVGSGTNDPLGFLNSVLGGFGIPNPFGGVTPGGGGTGGFPTSTGGGAGGCINLCQGSINAMGGGGTLGGGGGGTGVNPPGQLFGGGGEPSFQGGGGGIPTPSGGGGGTPSGGGFPGEHPPSGFPPSSNTPIVLNANGTWSYGGGGTTFGDATNAGYTLFEDFTYRAPTGAPAGIPVGGQPTGGFGQPSFGGGNQVSISTSQFPPMGGFGGGQPGFGGVTGPIGNPPVPPRIVQEAGLPSQAPNVNQDPTSWTIVESAGLVGTYDIIDNRGNVVQLGFRTLTDAEVYLNYFISFYEWVQSGSTGIPGPSPVSGGGFGTGGGFGGFGGTGGFGGGITATAGPASASAGPGGAFASAGNAIAQAFAGAGGSRKMIGPTPVPDMPFEPIPRAQGPFRSGQDNQEPIFDNSGIKIGADFGTPGGDSVTMEEVTEGGGNKEKGKRFRDRLAIHRAARAAVGGEYAEIANAIIDAIEEAFGNLMINLQLNNMIDGNMVNRALGKFQVKKVSVFA